MESYRKTTVIKHVYAFNPEIEAYSINLPNKKHYFLYEGKEHEVRGTIMDIMTHKGEILVNYSSDGTCDKLINGKLVKIEGYLIRLYYSNDNYLITCFRNLSDFKLYCNLLDLETNKLLLKKSIPYSLYSEGDEIIAYDKFYGEIKRINVETETIWSFSLESLAGSEHAPGERDSIEEVLGIAHGNLWFSSKFGRLVVLNIENGQVVKIISGNPYDRQLSLYDMTVGLGYCYLRSTDKNIISINGYEFQIIDTKIQKVIELYNYVECDPSGLGTYRSVFYPFLQGDYFTFVGQKEGEYGSCGWAGIYDYRARKLVWECEIVPEAERQKTGNQLVPGNHLYISGNKLYIKDIQDNLHIFEKDE